MSKLVFVWTSHHIKCTFTPSAVLVIRMLSLRRPIAYQNSVVASDSGVLVLEELVATCLSSFIMWSLWLTPCIRFAQCRVSLYGRSGICRGPRASGAPRANWGKIKKCVLPNYGIASWIVFTTAILHWHNSV